MALTDGLTGLGNRRRLDLALEKEIARSRRQNGPLALIMLDIDYFKRFNDRYGHPAGDECLRQVAQVLKTSLKRPADLAARYGGEEFTIVLPDTDAAGACQLAAGILAAIRALKIRHVEHPAGIVTASAGVTVSWPSKDSTTSAGMIKAADAYLYAAKNAGRDKWYGASEDPAPRL
jgi:diguanylate cyclase (GGDEF)-like protein